MEENKWPLVSVICLCYNHRDFVIEAIQSVLDQDYPNTEVIVVDDFSSDGSGEIIENFCKPKNIRYILNTANNGNCHSFNEAYKHAQGEYIIDLAADDVLLPARIGIGVADLQRKEDVSAVHYSNAMLIDASGKELGLHTDLTGTIDSRMDMPEGDLFSEILSRYFICPPTLMAHRKVFEALGGYDESLSFEDFDFLVRASREFRFRYSPEVLVKRRVLEGSKSQVQYRHGSKDLRSVLAVCKKAVHLIKDDKERKALNRRLQFECRQVIIHHEPEIVSEYLQLMKETGISRIVRESYRIMSVIYPRFFEEEKAKANLG